MMFVRWALNPNKWKQLLCIIKITATCLSFDTNKT